MGCPSDDVARTPSFFNRGQCGSYSGSQGDATVSVTEGAITKRGFFPGGSGRLDSKNFKCNSMSSIKDGTSNTLAIIEACCGQEAGTEEVKGGTVKFGGGSPASCLATVSIDEPGIYSSTDLAADVHGQIHTDGRPAVLVVSTILPPNSPSCRTEVHNPGAGWGYQSASSYHSGGVNALRLDGSVSFFSDSIDCGPDMNTTEYTSKDPVGKSPFGVWGALGSIAGRETITN